MTRHYILIMLFSAILSIGYSLSQDKNVSFDNDIPANHWAVSAVIEGIIISFERQVLIAGSNTYWNYRHQADVCHAYQILRKNGVPKEHIITLSYNDVVNHPKNPFKGQLFNKPTGDRPGVDVYKGCEIDYSGEEVTVKNVQGVLTGDKSLASKKVLESTENDYVFINFVDHGDSINSWCSMSRHVNLAVCSRGVLLFQANGRDQLAYALAKLRVRQAEHALLTGLDLAQLSKTKKPRNAE
ncbi:conserved hypothetical protein [Perkinsus marinus ATCC 50983]|uniref:Legumain n=1 Tax=Perkinsus marinus (strain ATCC 50983 / TXsc) TaxID=423536 RepID=C5KMY3_PERM5|nr:conserved hypothetical protein [Perkinsus marinus ATCC 50983]EER14291.1 conserved hypothetical protein [Perkinsus marinus ATCC 50983]|eukprot:XP_002782496.1 conserved hypothetical protein [Perkinsus marinus ATCC 50983]